LVKHVVNHIMIYFGVPPFRWGGIFFYTIYGLNIQMSQYLFVNLYPNIILKLITKKILRLWQTLRELRQL
jgi:hypothetical protein